MTEKVETRLAEAALRLLARKSWRELTLASVAKSARLPLAQLQAIAPAKSSLLGLVLTRLGDETAARYKPGKSQSVHDRLFDVSMAWFDVLGARKAAIGALYEGLRHDPISLFTMRAEAFAAAQWLMALAEADSGPAFNVRAIAFAAILARAIPVWLNDDADLTKTMARLDGDLHRGETLLGRL